MNLRISDPKVTELAQKLAEQTGEDATVAVIRALEERLARLPVPDAVHSEAAKLVDREARKKAIMAALAKIDKLPVLDSRTPDELIGYNEHGAFD